MSGLILSKLLKEADEGGYAIPSFNYSDIWDFKAIVEAAEEERAPIMIASNPLVVTEFGAETCAAIGNVAMKKAKIPLIHHLDHSFSVEMCKECMDFGYPSVMIDASKYDLETNIKMVNEVMEYAEKKHVHVEAEVGKIKGKGIEGEFKEGDDFLVRVEDAVALSKATRVNSLAIGIGSAHGFYQGKPQLNFDRLDEVNKAIDTRLVLHGGTGIPREDVQKAIRLGINKVNVGTIIHCTYMNSLRKELNQVGDNPYTLDVMKKIRNDIKEVVKTWIQACMVNGRA
jgi:ketose-bisphosphate aldolase